MSDVQKIKDGLPIEKVSEYIQNYYGEHNKLPTVKKVSQEFNLSIKRVVECYRILQDRGILTRNFSRYAAGNILEERGKKRKSIIRRGKKLFLSSIRLPENFIFGIIRFICLIIGVCGWIASFSLTFEWSIRSFEPIIGMIISFSCVSAAIISPEIVILLAIYGKEKNKKGKLRIRFLYKIFILIFIFAWIISFSFSVLSTIAGQYNKRMKTEQITDEVITEDVKNSKIWNSYEDERDKLSDDIERKESEVLTLSNRMDQFSNEDLEDKSKKKLYDEFKNNKDRIEKELKELNDKLDKRIKDDRTFIEKQNDSGIFEDVSIRNDSFYVWIARGYEIPPMQIEFWSSMFPTVFIDVIAPLFLAIAFFLKKRKIEEGNNNNE